MKKPKRTIRKPLETLGNQKMCLNGKGKKVIEKKREKILFLAYP